MIVAIVILIIIMSTIILADIQKPVTVVNVDPDPKKVIGTQCIPAGSNGMDVKLNIHNVNQQIIQSWQINCDDFPDAIATVERINQEYCIDDNRNSQSSTVGGTTIQPLYDTTSNRKTIQFNDPPSNFVFPCGIWVDELLEAMRWAYGTCCL